MRVWDSYVRRSDIMIIAWLEIVFTSLNLSPVENCESLICSQLRTPASFPLTDNPWTGWWLRFSFHLKFLLFKVSLGVWNCELRIVLLCYWKAPLQNPQNKPFKPCTERAHFTEKHDFILAWFVFKSGQWFRCECLDCSWAGDQIRLLFILGNSLYQLW